MQEGAVKIALLFVVGANLIFAPTKYSLAEKMGMDHFPVKLR